MRCQRVGTFFNALANQRFLSTRFAFVIHFRTFGLFSIVPFLTDTEAKSN